MSESTEERRYNFKPYQPAAVGPRCVEYFKLSDADQQAIDGYMASGQVPKHCSLAVKTFLRRHHGVGMA